MDLKCTKQKTIYKIKNWKAYNQALIHRGFITLWISDDAIKAWLYDGPKQQGRNDIYTDTAIQCCLTLRVVFHLQYRQTQGFIESLLTVMQTELPTPNYTTLCKRAKKLDVDLAKTIGEGDSIDIAIDSTGLKVYGEGEWKVRKHGWNKHRTWRKLHLAVHPKTGEIVAEELTTNSESDSSQVEPLLQDIGATINQAAMDGAYDIFDVHDLLQERGITPLIPPQKNAKIRKHGNCKDPPLPRDEIIRQIRKTSRKQWKQNSGYHKRSLSETAMYRQKVIFGSHLKNRELDNQKVEARLRCRALNIMTRQGMPKGEWVNC